MGIICGSGLSELSKSLEQSETINYSEIPGFSVVTVAGAYFVTTYSVLQIN